MKTQINIKIDESIKTAAQTRAKELGLSLSAVINATLSQFARTGELHVRQAPQATPQLQQIITQAQEEYAAKKTSGPFSNVDELMVHLQQND